MSTSPDIALPQRPLTGTAPAVTPDHDVDVPDTAPGAGGDPFGAESTDVTITFDSDELPCRMNEADLWFADTPAGLEQAKAHCRECPLRLECLDGALERGEPWGVWGGEIFDHGVVIARKRPRGRPRKNDVAAVAA